MEEDRKGKDEDEKTFRDGHRTGKRRVLCCLASIGNPSDRAHNIPRGTKLSPTLKRHKWRARVAQMNLVQQVGKIRAPKPQSKGSGPRRQISDMTTNRFARQTDWLRSFFSFFGARPAMVRPSECVGTETSFAALHVL